MYSYITCRSDIGYAVTTLSKFSSAPTDYHYKLLKGVTKYLRSIPYDPSVSFDVKIDSPQLVSFVDADNANELKKSRSTTSYVFTFCKGAIVYKSITQSLTAGSLTEGEFIATHSAAKAARYLRFIMFESGY